MSDQLQQTQQSELTPKTEEIRPGPVFVPAVDIFETETAITVLADMPGVTAENLNIDINDGVLTLFGTVDNPPTARQRLTTEYRTGSYKRQFNVSNAIEQGSIEATLKQGVLHLVLPKVERAQPRRIAVRGE